MNVPVRNQGKTISDKVALAPSKERMYEIWQLDEDKRKVYDDQDLDQKLSALIYKIDFNEAFCETIVELLIMCNNCVCASKLAPLTPLLLVSKGNF